MKPRSRTKSTLRMLPVLAVALGAVGAATYVSNGDGLQQADSERVAVAVPQRPSYLSPLPEITERELDAGRIVASAAADAPDTISLASAEGQLASELGENIAPAADAPRLADIFRVTADGLNVRAGPSSASSVLFMLYQGDEVRVAEADGGWRRVISPSGESGWVFGKYLSPIATE